jgi:hypothetical protein
MAFENHTEFRKLLPGDLDERVVARALGGATIRRWIATEFARTAKSGEAELADFFYKVAELTGEEKDTISDTAYTSLVANWKRGTSPRLAVASYYTLHCLPSGKRLAEEVDREIFGGKTFEEAVGQKVPGTESESNGSPTPRSLFSRGSAAIKWFWGVTITLSVAVAGSLIAEQVVPYFRQGIEEDSDPAELTEIDQQGQAERDAGAADSETGGLSLAPARHLTIRVYGNELEYQSIQNALRNLPVSVERRSRRSDCHEGTPVTSIWPDQSVDFAEFVSLLLELETDGIVFYEAFPKRYRSLRTIDVGSAPDQETCTVDMSREPFTRAEIVSARHFCWQHRPSAAPPRNWSQDEIARWCYSR